MRQVLLTGGAGQLGVELLRRAWSDDEVTIIAPGRSELDLTCEASIRALFERVPVAAVINAAAYTAVDKAETEVGPAFAANATGPALLAHYAKLAGAPLIHVSTDYVFNGRKPTPYVEDDATDPLGVYGASKLAGEMAVRLGHPRSVVLRTAWVVSAHRANFVKTMRRLAASRSELTVVADQIGCPTSAADLAGAIQTILRAHLRNAAAPTGIYHFVNGGEASWCELARFVLETGGSATTVRPITTADYPTPARRPANSRLSTNGLTRDFNIEPRPWTEAVREIVSELDALDGPSGDEA